MNKQLIIAEKKSVAEDIAKALGVKTKGNGFLEGERAVVTWAVGHLLELQDPEEIDKKYKAWQIKDLPIIPDQFRYNVVSKTKNQYKVIKTLLKREDISSVVNACDAGREGELIFREIVEKEKVKLPMQRLWLQSLTREAILDGFSSLYPAEKFNGLADAAKARSESDWLIGINGTRAVTRRLQSKFDRTVFSVGRVQTPTLAMIVEKELEILSHEPRQYWKIEADFEYTTHSYHATFHFGQEDRIFEKKQEINLFERCQNAKQWDAKETRKESKSYPPALFDLTSLQREANRRHSMSASRTLQAAQRLYEKYKVLTYPRTDSKHLPEDYVEILKTSLNGIASIPQFGKFAKEALKKVSGKDRRVFDNKKISDHFAIIPTGQVANLEGDDLRIFQLVVRRVISIFLPPAEYELVERKTSAEDLVFISRGKFLKTPGWMAVWEKEEDEGADLLPLQEQPAKVKIKNLNSISDQTKPPARIGEAKLLSLMETAGKYVNDEDLVEVLEGKGIGTPATRADIIENLISKGYVERVGNSLKASSKGIRLIDVLERIGVKFLRSVDLTATLESMLRDVEGSKITKKIFDQEMIRYVKELVEEVRNFQYEDLYASDEPIGVCPKCGSLILENMFGYHCEKNTQQDSSCTFRFRKEYYGYFLHRTQVKNFLQSKILEDCTFVLFGKVFKGILRMGEDSEVEGFRLEQDGSLKPLKTRSTAELQNEESVQRESSVFSPFLTQDGVFRITSDAFYFELPKFPQVLGKAPKGVENFVGRLPNEVCERQIKEQEALDFFLNGKTDWLENFISKKGKAFTAKLYLKANGRYGFKFLPRGTKKGVESEN